MKKPIQSPATIAIEIFIRLGFLILLVAWCLRLLYPFAGIIVWSIILAIAAEPVYNALNTKLKGRTRVAAAILISLGLLIIIIPSALFVESMVEGIKTLKTHLSENTLVIPSPDKKVAGWPLIGQKLYDTWELASNNLRDLLLNYKEQITNVAEKVVRQIVGVGGAIVQFIISTIIAGLLLATRGTNETASKFFRRLVGARGDEFADITFRTVGNVTKGVLGVAIIQALLVGIGFLLAGIPYAGVWALLVMILAILQLPAIIVVFPVIVYLFSTTTTGAAIAWTVYLLLAGLSDNVLKPVLLGKGAPVPMLVIFLGVIGGFMMSGFLGLFTGAIILSLGYKLFLSWLNTESDDSTAAHENKTGLG